MAKQLMYEEAARGEMREGLAQLAAAVKVTMGPTGRNVVLQKSWGSPRVTKDGVTLIPLRVDASDDEATDVAIDLREELGVGTDGVYLTGQGALWAGLQEVSKHDLEKAERIGFPIVLLILLGVFGSLAAPLDQPSTAVVL